MVANTVLSIAACLLVLLSGLDASLVTKNGGYHTVAERQANTPCNVQMDCFPANLTASRYNVSTDLINCVNNVCVCSQSCFYLNGSTCGYSKCGWYAPATNVCTPIDQISGETVYLLSTFLSGVGAANFYIGQNGLGGAQLAIFLFLILACIFCCAGWAHVCQGSKSTDNPRCYIAIGLTFTAVTLLTLLVIISWWLADLLIFGRNTRPDGRGCPLFQPPISADDSNY